MHKFDQKAVLVAVHRRVNEPGPGGQTVEQGAHHDVGFLSDHDDMAAGLDGAQGMGGPGLGIAGALHQGIDRCRQQQFGILHEGGLLPAERLRNCGHRIARDQFFCRPPGAQTGLPGDADLAVADHVHLESGNVAALGQEGEREGTGTDHPDPDGRRGHTTAKVFGSHEHDPRRTWMKFGRSDTFR